MSDVKKSEENKLQKQIELLAENVNTIIYNQRKHLLGRVLTVLDAVASDPEQRKATKDLVHEIFYSGSYWNEIKWHFKEISRANGFPYEPAIDVGLEEPAQGNPYKNI